ncbi:YdcF family protein [Staphylococcus sp. SQ8-PEA]|uniref:YdcF family protein n=1 Tax=Staphylococcus marylandisciuri TaxID=2981529 RepID=A0ABT2QMS1_9STAP|nr:YdcF family protein [Staphylococcus marylandisciuri]MCU5745254.1 YdcF family protein [Staphylococcus marylandisciuri]
MTLLTTILCLLNLILFLGIYCHFSKLITINIYIFQVVIGFCIIFYHLATKTWPIDFLVLLLLQTVLLHLRYLYLLTSDVGLKFVKRLYRIVGWAVLFTLSTLYISLLPIGLNVIFMWLSLIGLSTLYTFNCYVTFTAAFYSKRQLLVEPEIFLVLGAGIFTEEVTPMLASRLDKVIQVWSKHPRASIIVSGGQGADEPISEALAMKRYLVKNGVPDTVIIMETQSTSTFQNIEQSYKVLKDNQMLSSTIVCITSHFHILRALRFGQKFGLKMEGLGSSSPLTFLHVMMERDFLALMYQYRLLLTIYFALLFFSTLLTMWLIP